MEINTIEPKINSKKELTSEMKTLEWWILKSMLDPLFLLISRLV